MTKDEINNLIDRGFKIIADVLDGTAEHTPVQEEMAVLFTRQIAIHCWLTFYERAREEQVTNTWADVIEEVPEVPKDE